MTLTEIDHVNTADVSWQHVCSEEGQEMAANHTHADLHPALHQRLPPGAEEIHFLIFK